MSNPPTSPSLVSPEDQTPAFDTLGLHPDLLKGIKAIGYVRPTPIQAAVIPGILAGRDVIGCAQTGTGKTAAFLLPILHRLLLQGKGRGYIRALIVAPTRELALQSMQQLKALSQYVHLTGAAIFGGVPMEYQTKALAQGVDIISATPGRLLDHIYSGRIDFVDLGIFVLDEVDRMLDMGFLPDVTHIISLLPPKRQNLVFSATVPEEVLPLVHQIVHDPIMVKLQQRTAPAVGITQAVYPVPRRLKTDLLIRLIREHRMKSVLVFMRTKISASRLAQSLDRRGFRVSLLHGDRSQSQRLHALEQFRRGRNQIMVATEIAARGIDISEISHVINFDVPETPDAYVHRVGRTARAGATGDAFTLMSEEEEPLVQAIERVLTQRLPRVQLPDFPDEKRETPSPDHDRHRRPSRTHHQSSRPHPRRKIR